MKKTYFFAIWLEFVYLGRIPYPSHVPLNKWIFCFWSIIIIHGNIESPYKRNQIWPPCFINVSTIWLPKWGAQEKEHPNSEDFLLLLSFDISILILPIFWCKYQQYFIFFHHCVLLRGLVPFVSPFFSPFYFIFSIRNKQCISFKTNEK